MMTATVSIRLPDEIAKGLENLAGNLDRSKTYIVRKAIEQYLEEYSDYLIALERLNDKDDDIISSKDLREQLGL